MAGLLPPGFSFDDEQPAAPTSVLPPGFRFDDEPVPQPDTAPLPPARPADLGAEAANPQPADVPLPPARPTDLGPPNDYGPSDWPTTAAPTGTGGVLDSVLGNAGKLTPEQGAAEQEANAAAAQQALRASRENAARTAAAPTPLPAFSDGPPAQESEAQVADAMKGAAFSNAAAAAAAPPPTLTPGRAAVQSGINSAGKGVVAIAKPVGEINADLGAPQWKQAIEGAEGAIDKAFPNDPGREADVGNQVARSMGSLVPFIASGAIAKGLGLSVEGVTAAVGALQGGGAGYEAAEKAGAGPMARYLAMFGQAGIGAAQAVPYMRMLDRIEEMAPGSITSILKQGAQTSVEQVAVQGLSTVGENGIAKLLYEKDRGLLDGVVQSAQVAAIVGGTLGLAGGFYGSGAARQAFADRLEKSTPAELDSFLGTVAGKSSRAEIDEFLRQQAAKEAGGQNVPERSLLSPPKTPEATKPTNPTDVGHVGDQSVGPEPAQPPPTKPTQDSRQAESAEPAPTSAPESHIDKNTPTADGVLSMQPGDDLLRAFGHDDEEIALMSPEERAARIEEAKQAGVTPTEGLSEVTPATEAGSVAPTSGSDTQEPTLPPGFKFDDEPVPPKTSGETPQTEVDSKGNKPEAPAEQARKPASAPSAPRQPQTLLSFIKAGGGIKDVGGNLRAAGLHRYPGLINNKSGMDPDRAREAAAEAGYLGADRDHAHSNTTPDDLLNELQKHPTYSTADEEQLVQWRAHTGGKVQREKDLSKAENDLHAEHLDAGVPTHLIEDHYVREGARLHVDEGVPLQDAYEQAVMRDTREKLGDKAREYDADIPWDDYEAPSAPKEAGTAKAAEAGGTNGRPGEDRNGSGQGEIAPDRTRSPRNRDEERPHVEAGAEGKPQLVIPGAEKIGDGELAQRKSDEDLKPKVGQKDTDGLALFGDGHKQTDLLDQPAKKEEKPAIPAGFHMGPPNAVKDGIHKGRFSVIVKRDAPWSVDRVHGDTPEEATAAGHEWIKKNTLAEKKPDVRQAIENAYLNATGGKYGEMVGLDKIRAALPELDRATVDAALKKILSSEAETATLQRNDDPRRITPAQKEAAFSPAGEPFHTISISKPTAEPKGKPLAERVLDEMSKTVGQRGYLADLRKAFPDVPRAELDKALTEIHLADNNARLMRMDNPRDKRAAESNAAALDFKGEPLHHFWVNEAKPAAPKTLPDAVADHLYAGNAFPNIIKARQFAKENGGKDLNPKQIEEAIEHGVVLAARRIVADGKTPEETFNRLVKLYADQPGLKARTSTSIEQQAYSTPAPLAYVASRLAHITKESTVLEPTAGNGMLLIAATPDKVRANELNNDRANVLAEQGFKVSRQDASTYSNPHVPVKRSFDVVIANPPFGVVKDGDKSKRFKLDEIQKGYETSEIDHAIALRALERMKDDGHAVLILGGINKLVRGEEKRSDAYHGKAKREFFHVLYNRYNVTDHFTVAGELYEKQGAGWPIDVIAISGRGKSAKSLPSVDVPPMLRSWDELGEKLRVNDGLARQPGAEDDSAADLPVGGAELARPPVLDEQHREDAGRSEPPAVNPEERRPGKVRAGRGGEQRDAGSAPSDTSQPTVPPGTVPHADRPDGVAPTGRGPGLEPKAAPVRQEQETEGQSAYRPKSTKASGLGTLVPRNMRRATEEALEKVAKSKGSIDKYVADAIGMKEGDLAKRFGAEQVDALGLAIYNMERGSGFIIGDQTGIGKGRVNAAIIRYAIHNHLTPIFVTEKPNLYGDMYRDLKDIGTVDYLGREPKILMTNANERIPLDDEGKNILKTPDGKEHANELLKIAAAGNLLDHDMLFTTYNQMQTVKGATTPRIAILRALAPKAIVIFDESHNAGGTEVAAGGEGPKPQEKFSRATFARELVQKAHGVFYSSATYAKRPSVMSLYSKTDMTKAVDKPEQLAPAMQSGGVPMQQVVAAMLAEAGQYIRRERSFAGISYDTNLAPVDRSRYEAFSGSIAAIHKFSESAKAAIKNIDKDIKAQAQHISPDGSTGGAGANSTQFTSIMHNLVGQFLLAQKADIAAQEALAALKRDEKPVITVSNTMESFLKEYVEDNHIAPGDPIPLGFSDLLKRYLERTRTITIKKPFSKEPGKKHYLKDSELGPAGVASYNRAKKIIEEAEVGNLPISPIDYIRDELARAGYKVGEITGRNSGISYANKKTPRYYTRAGKETSIAGRRKAIFDFNNGDLHGMVLNQAGATGLSLHASEKYKDQRRRHMMIVQAEANPDTHMQMLGRINRTGQVVLPTYTQIVADIPAEKRYAAVLAKKMASLNASTTADRKGALTAKDVVDIMNEYGDQVAYSIMRENPQINAALGDPVKMEERAAEGAMRKLTGRIPLLKVKHQEELYADIENAVKSRIAEKEAAGENVLEAKRLDLDAKPVSSMTVREGQGDNPFTQPVKLNILDVKRQSKPFFAKDLIEHAAAAVELTNPDKDPTTALRDIETIGKDQNKRQVQAALDAFRPYAKELLDEAELDTTRESIRARTADNEKRFTDTMQVASVGRQVSLVNDDQRFSGIITKVARDGKAQNPLALSTWKVRIAVPGKGQLWFPFSRLYTAEKPAGHGDDDDSLYRLEATLPDSNVLKNFDEMSKDAREQRAMLTGNLLAAYAWKKGQIVHYTDHEGAVHQGVLLNSDIQSAEDAMAGRGVPLNDPQAVLDELTARGGAPLVSSSDSGVAVGLDRGRLVVSVPSSKAKGGDYFLDRDIRSAADSDFIKRGSAMVLHVPRSDDRIFVLKALMAKGVKFEKMPEERQPVAHVTRPAPMAPHVKQMVLDALASADLARGLVGKHAEVNIVDSIQARDDVLKQSGADPETHVASGLYWPGRKLIELAFQRISSSERKATAVHEAWHALENADVFTPQEKAVLKREIPRLRGMVRARGGGGQGFSEEAMKGMPDFEVRAYAFEDYFKRAEAQDPNAGHGLHIALRRIFEKVREFFRSLRNMLQGAGFHTAEDVFENVRRGEVGKREAGPEDGWGMKLFDQEPAARIFRKKPVPGAPRRYFEDEALVDRIKRKVGGGINLERVEENVLDLNAPVRHLQNDLQSQGYNIGPGMDVYKAKRLLGAKATARNEDFDRDYLKPITGKMAEHGLTAQDVGEYMFATHAPERNAHMDQVDATNNGRGSGITDPEAQRLLGELNSAGKLNALQNEIEPLIQNMREFILKTRVAGGLMSPKQAQEYRAMYSHYAPLQGWEDPNNVPEGAVFSGGGGKMSVRGPESKHAFGRRSISDNPLANLISQARTAIERSERNAADGTVWRLLKSIPKAQRDDIALLDKGRSMKVLDSTTGQMFFVPEPGWRNRKDVVTFKIGGVPHYMVFHDEHLAEAINRLRPEALVTGLKTIGSFVNLSKSFFTHYSPTFLFRHFFMRYPVEAAVNSFEDGFGAMFRSMKGYPGGSMFRALVAADKMTTPDRAALAQKVSAGTATNAEVLQHRYHQMRAAGGMMRFSDFAGVEATKKRLDIELARTDANMLRRGVAILRAAHRFIDHMTNAMDNAQRLAAFVEAMDHQGATVSDAAMKAREATVDFSLKGRYSKYVGLMWPFGNTAAQTASRMIRAQGRSGRMRWMLAGVMSLGFANALYNYLYGGTDKDGTPYYEKIADWTRRLNMIFMTPFGDEKGRPYYGMLAMPYNYAAPMVVGAALAQLMLKQMGVAKESYGKITHQVMHSVFEALTPVAQENSMLGKITPMVLLPYLHVAMNESFAGFKIYKDSDSGLRKGLARSEQGKPSTGEYWKTIAKGINSLTGGNRFESGWLDPPPEAIREIAGQVTANQESAIRRTGDLIDDVMHGRRPQPNDVEMARAAVGGDHTYDKADQGAFYDDRNRVYAIQESYKKMAKEDPKAARSYLEAHRTDLDAAKIYKNATHQLSFTYQDEDKLHADTKVSDADRDRKEQEIEKKRIKIMDDARTNVEKRRKQAEEKRLAHP